MNLSLFYIILVNILLILSMNRSTFPPCRRLILWPNVLTEVFLAFGTTEFSYKTFLFLYLIAHYYCCFCFFCILSIFLKFLLKKALQHLNVNMFFVFITYGLQGCDTVLLQKLVESLFLPFICCSFLLSYAKYCVIKGLSGQLQIND